MASIICVVGDKGGTGKSTWARGLADLYRHTQRPAALFDGDWLARSLFKFFRGADEQGRALSLDRQDPRRGCILYDARDRRFGRDLLLNSMAMPGIDVILHDLPAGFRTDISGLMATSTPAEAVREFVACANAMGHSVVLVNVMTPSPSDYHTAPWLAETLGRTATVIAVRNGMFDSGSFATWQREAAKGFAAAGGIEIEMPRLDTAAAILCDQRMLRFTTAVRDERVPLADRMRILSWVRRFAESVGPIAEALRLPADVAARIAALRVEASAEVTAPEMPTPEIPVPEMAAAPQPVPEPSRTVPERAVGPAPVAAEASDTEVPQGAPVPRPRGPAARRSLSDILPGMRRPNGKAAGGPGGTAAEDRFLLPADTPIA
ncbi:MAG TPA: hypothetical protein VD995_24880 [Azospirillum sp.]|nr:hypothetical protein [Azospirillum sp.]